MSRKTTLAMIAACTLGLALPAVAQQPLSPPQVTPGTQIYVTDAEGLERKYRFVASDETGLHVQLNGRDLTVAWSSVCLVERRGDGVADGFLKGAALAGGLYVAVGLVSGGSLDEIAPFAAGGALAWARSAPSSTPSTSGAAPCSSARRAWPGAPHRAVRGRTVESSAG